MEKCWEDVSWYYLGWRQVKTFFWRFWMAVSMVLNSQGQTEAKLPHESYLWKFLISLPLYCLLFPKIMVHFWNVMSLQWCPNLWHRWPFSLASYQILGPRWYFFGYLRWHWVQLEPPVLASANNDMCSAEQHWHKWVLIEEVMVLGCSALVRSCVFCSRGRPLRGTLANRDTFRKGCENKRTCGRNEGRFGYLQPD